MNKQLLLSVESWHERFTQQARWTRQVRQHIIHHLGLKTASRVLEVGCGTGAVTVDLAQLVNARVHGLDINFEYLQKAQMQKENIDYTCGDAYALPYPSHFFDACYCHFLLLWLANPLAALQEMKRVTRKGGWLIIMAEPDYDARIDYPDELSLLGEKQALSLERQGAVPNIGRKAAHLLAQCGCQEILSGLMGGQWDAAPAPRELESEREMLKADLHNMMPAEQIEALIDVERKAWSEGYRILFVPTFYAWGRVGKYSFNKKVIS